MDFEGFTVFKNNVPFVLFGTGMDVDGFTVFGVINFYILKTITGYFGTLHELFVDVPDIQAKDRGPRNLDRGAGSMDRRTANVYRVFP